MTIRRQYSLPNCTLVLDGFSDSNSTTGIPDSRPVMSSLFNAECHFVGCEQPLLGGRDFLTSLVTTVSNYAQEFLSGIPRPAVAQPAPGLVSLVKGDRDNIHQLQATIDPSNDPKGIESHSAGKPTQVNLSTIQLFDLLEAIDQFLADKRTLPDIMIPLQPIRKAIAQPIAAQAVPLGLGFASLVAASLIGYALPFQQVPPPKSSVQTTTAPTKPAAAPTTAPTASPQPAATTTPAPTSAAPSKTGKITEATQIGFLERKLQRDLRQNWQGSSQIKQVANFQVNVNQDGQIVSYQSAGTTTATQSNLTPLAKLAIKNPDANQAIGNFNVAFNPTGSIDIKPSVPLEGTMNLGKAIADPQLQTTLAEQLKTTLQKSLTSTKPIDTQNLDYRVAVTTTGEIADYEPTDRRAYDNEPKTPLPKLAKFNAQAAISQEPLAQYKVTFQPDGKIIVAPK
ncbi:DUF4335 domain-containing protein [Chamaesiphon sp. VAR_48_metabat_403]|uniref:DUF4335 domain-containing protein n=1 Tax=Chamaesiphon sp. VAR_48_metabat_403 TaxID=2964700 RepID=UPI00286DD1C1|nr:DUF4335 domain-containing protein [Chamaesiphon sp. VAR_48_metabat_403]